MASLIRYNNQIISPNLADSVSVNYNNSIIGTKSSGSSLILNCQDTLFNSNIIMNGNMTLNCANTVAKTNIEVLSASHFNISTVDISGGAPDYNSYITTLNTSNTYVYKNSSFYVVNGTRLTFSSSSNRSGSSLVLDETFPAITINGSTVATWSNLSSINKTYSMTLPNREMYVTYTRRPSTYHYSGETRTFEVVMIVIDVTY